MYYVVRNISGVKVEKFRIRWNEGEKGIGEKVRDLGYILVIVLIGYVKESERKYKF